MSEPDRPTPAPKTKAKKPKGPSPFLVQYLAIKDQHPEALLFFRMGDFYELFFQDAIDAAEILGITLTARGEYEGKPIPMAGVPFHAAEGYLARLIASGRRIAVCEQTETPAEAKKRGYKAIVNREKPDLPYVMFQQARSSCFHFPPRHSARRFQAFQRVKF